MNIALVLAGGSGSRFGGECPKQFVDLLGKPVIAHSLLAFQNNKLIDEIYIVCHEQWVDYATKLKETYAVTKIKAVVIGGETRQESSYNGLFEIEKLARDEDIVLIHDSARPNISQRIINENIINAEKNGACATVISVTDTVFLSDNQTEIDVVLNRDKLFLAQTPQTFRLSLIIEAHRKYVSSGMKSANVTDDVSLLLYQKKQVKLVMGDKKNIKLTTTEDFEIIKQYID